MENNPTAKEIREYADYCVGTMFSWIGQRYSLSPIINDYTLIVSFKHNRIHSHGGWHVTDGKDRPYINLALHNCLNFKPQIIAEYPWYKTDKEIGQRYAKTWKYYVRFLAAHECSHTVELMPFFVNDHKTKKMLTKKFGRVNILDDHADAFQSIYRIMRNQFVNGKRTI
jgi:hypothetical protein